MTTRKRTRSTTPPGKLLLVGAGPGDPDLITVKGLRALQQADVIVYDYLAPLALLSHARPDAEKIYVGKVAGSHTMKQEEINALLRDQVEKGKLVVRLKGGDPFVFGRGGEEILALGENPAFEVVPGVSAGIAVPAFAGIPVTHRGMATSVAFITGHEDPSKPASTINWPHLAMGVDTLVFYMGVGNLAGICGELITNGRPPSTPVAVIQWGTTARQRAVSGTLETIVRAVEEAGVSSPAITIVGSVVGLRDGLQWFEKRPLFSRRIIVTRTREQASSLSRHLSELGAEVMELPTIEIKPLGDSAAVKSAIKNIKKFDWIVFTSPNGVRCFLDKVMGLEGDVRALGAARIASVGPATTEEIKAFHLKPDLTASDAVAEGLVADLWKADSWRGRNVLIPRAEKGREVLPDTLTGWGAKVTVLPVYRTVKPARVDTAIVEAITHGDYDLITFTSSSTFENFVFLIGLNAWREIKKSLKSASIGPVTSAAMRAMGVAPTIEASVHTIPGLITAIGEHLTHDRHI